MRIFKEHKKNIDLNLVGRWCSVVYLAATIAMPCLIPYFGRGSNKDAVDGRNAASRTLASELAKMPNYELRNFVLYLTNDVGGKRGSLNSRGATSSIKSLPVEYRDVLQRYLSGQINLPEQTFERQKVLDRIIDQLTKRGISSQHIEMRFREWQRKVEKSANTNRT